ncbi:MAG: hypothetical protein IJQ80_03500 [Clostridia bacterium]|nr:hypothetical protein [Clostridia bacterium]
MVKGCQKRTIHIKDTGSRYYEEAYFVLRPGVTDAGDMSDDMIGEAIRIAGESVAPRGAGSGRRAARWLGAFFAGFALGALVFAALFLVTAP